MTQEVPIGSLVEAVATRDPSRVGDPEFVYVDLSAVDQDMKEIRGPRTIARSDAPSRARQVIHRGDVLMSTVRPNLNGVAHVPEALSGAIASTGFTVLRPGPKLDSRYLFHWVRTHRFVADMVKNATGASYPAISDTIVRESLVPLLPLEEQRRIAAILDRADALRTKRREAIAHLDTLTQSIFLQMFGDPVENPRGLPIRALDAWVDPDRPVTYGILKPGPEIPNGVPYVRVAEMRDGGIALPGVRRTSPEIARQYRRSTLRAGDLLISIRGHVGRMADVPVVLDGANITQDSARLAIDPRSVEYVRATLQSTRLQAWMARRTKGAAVQGLNLGDLRLAPLPVPPLREQEEFGRLARGMRRNGEIARRQLVDCEALAASLCDRAFKGEL